MRSETIVLSLLPEEPSEGQRDEGTFPGGKAQLTSGQANVQVQTRRAPALSCPTSRNQGQ